MYFYTVFGVLYICVKYNKSLIIIYNVPFYLFHALAVREKKIGYLLGYITSIF